MATRDFGKDVFYICLLFCSSVIACHKHLKSMSGTYSFLPLSCHTIKLRKCESYECYQWPLPVSPSDSPISCLAFTAQRKSQHDTRQNRDQSLPSALHRCSRDVTVLQLRIAAPPPPSVGETDAAGRRRRFTFGSGDGTSPMTTGWR